MTELGEREIIPLDREQVNIIVRRIVKERVGIGRDFKSAMEGHLGSSRGWRGFFSRFFLQPNYDAAEGSVDDWTRLVSFAQGVAVGAGLLPPRVELSNGRVVEFNLGTGEDKNE